MIDTDRLSQDLFFPADPFVPVLKEEPIRFDTLPETFDHFIVGAAMRGASDITAQSEARIRIQINGRQHFGTRRILLRSEIDMILSNIWRSADAAGILRQGRPLDFSYEVHIDRTRRQRFRVNATGIMADGSEGIEITLRALPSVTPTLDDVAFEEELREFIDPKSGLIVVGGGTGHGKSTTMAAITRHHIENTDNPRKIVDLQAPIEFTYADILTEASDSPSIIGQSEIGEGRNLRTFADGVWAALRRAPAIINVGEARDVGSMEASIEACLTGHIVNTTTHAGSVAEGLRRMAIAFPGEEQAARAFDLISSLQLFVVQRLIRTTDGRGRVAVREYLVFDDAIRDRFFETSIDGWSGIVSQVMKDARANPNILARSTAESAQRLVASGKIGAADARRFIPQLAN